MTMGNYVATYVAYSLIVASHRHCHYSGPCILEALKWESSIAILTIARIQLAMPLPSHSTQSLPQKTTL